MHPDAVPIAGGTDLMVDINFGRRRPPRLLDLTRVEELAGIDVTGEVVRIGAGATYTELMDHLGAAAPSLAIASRTVGSLQIRNRGTLGGNLGTASPAGDGLPPLVAAGAEVEVASKSGTRSVPVVDFCVAPKRNVLAPDELIVAIHLPRARGPQQFAKVGTRNAMVIAVCSFALQLDRVDRQCGTGIGSAAPRIVQATAAEAFANGLIGEHGLWERTGTLSPTELAEFGRLASGAASPIDDVRGTAAYRRHALGVLAARTLSWALADRAGLEV